MTMFHSLLITIFSLSFIVIFHELGHYFFARIFRVKVEELGLFLPPRIYSRKIGDTIYSINLIPFGAFVRLFGEREQIQKEGSFSYLPVFKRAIIVLGGIIAFWVLATILFSIVLYIGFPKGISDEENVPMSTMMVMGVLPKSPAISSGIRLGDEILSINGIKVEKVKEVQQLTRENSGREITIEIKRGDKILNIKAIPRVSPPENEGPLGILISRVVFEKHSLLDSIGTAPKVTGTTTLHIILGYIDIIKNLFRGEKIEAQLLGPIGTSHLIWQATQWHPSQFLNFLAVLSIYLAIFNLLPIPALDGGRLLFLMWEKFKGKPISKDIEEKITALSFFFLIILAIYVTLQDIKRIF